MRKLCLLGLLMLTGCQGTTGPFQPRGAGRVDDPRLPITEQQREARDRLALPDENRPLGEGVARPGTVFTPNR